MHRTTSHATVSSILRKLREKEYQHEFFVTHQGLSAGRGRFYTPEELRLVRTYSFPEKSNVSCASILHVIEAIDGTKGYSLDAFGAYRKTDDWYQQFIKKIPAKSTRKKRKLNDGIQVREEIV